MMSSHAFAVKLDGAAYARCEKVRGLADWTEGLEALRVCWQGEDTSGNCGVCEKCLRTKLNFMEAGLVVPSSLGKSPTFGQIVTIQIRSMAVFNEFKQMLIPAWKKSPPNFPVVALSLLLLKSLVIMPLRWSYLCIKRMERACRRRLKGHQSAGFNG